ncbi:MAG TPA: hypothetical protein VHS78_17900, partial [Candidatus Elarobacter sp.]|nr:hypothetical protein [Candidatus Elarobacter sp.]
PEIQLTPIIFANEEFDYSWGARDRLFGLRRKTMKVYRYNTTGVRRSAAARSGYLRPEAVLQLEHEILLQYWKGEVLNAGASSFGAVIECEHAVVAINSSGEPLTFPGTFARWKTYNRSKYYQNQLHLINEHDVQVIAFTDDFFLDNNEDRVISVSRAR